MEGCCLSLLTRTAFPPPKNGAKRANFRQNHQTAAPPLPPPRTPRAPCGRPQTAETRPEPSPRTPNGAAPPAPCPPNPGSLLNSRRARSRAAAVGAERQEAQGPHRPQPRRHRRPPAPSGPAPVPAAQRRPYTGKARGGRGAGGPGWLEWGLVVSTSSRLLPQHKALRLTLALV